jgi:glycosyltransferase involved in cell wall biosynthesis
MKADRSLNPTTTEKPEIVFIFQGVLGGVSSFNYNIINFSKLKTRFYSRVIIIKEDADDRPLFTEHFDVNEQAIFNFSYKENQYHLQKRLNEFLGNAKGAIVTDHGLVVEAARRFNNPKTVFNLIHDFYYVKQQLKLGDWVDAVVAHASLFADAVFAADPDAFAGRSFFIPYGVQQLDSFPQKRSGPLNLVFLGRLEKGKGVLDLFNIQERLAQMDIEVNWTIIGKGTLKEFLLNQWKQQKVVFHEPGTTQEVYEILSEQDLFIFPTTFEGTPVAILECLANGVVTIANDLPGGIRDILTEGIGYRCKYNDIAEYVERIRELHEDRQLLNNMQRKCFELAHASYDIKTNADKYFELFLRFEEFRRVGKSDAKKLYKLDLPFVPNWVTKTVRGIK